MLKKITKYVLLLLILFLFLAGINSLTVPFRNKAQQYSKIENVPQKQTAILLGALVYQNGGLSDITKDRALTAVDLYNNKKVEKILVSGDHGRKKYDEVNTIKDFLLEQGIPAEDIFMDHAGFDTYDSIYRARNIFEVESATIVTQKFHLPRSLYIADKLRLEAVGIQADRHKYRSMARIWIRERLATFKAVLNIWLHSQPKFLGDKIPITGNSQVSWD